MLVSPRNLPVSAPGAGTTSMCFQAQLFLMWVLGSHSGPRACVAGSSPPLLFKAFLCSQEKNTLAALVLETDRLVLCSQGQPHACASWVLGGGGSGPHLAAAVCLGWFSELQEVQLLAQCNQGFSSPSNVPCILLLYGLFWTGFSCSPVRLTSWSRLLRMAA